MRGIVRHSIEHINKYGNNPACAGKGFAGEAAFDGAGNNPACAGKRLHEQQVYGATMEFSSTLSSTLAYYTPRTQLLNCYTSPLLSNSSQENPVRKGGDELRIKHGIVVFRRIVHFVDENQVCV